MSGLEIFLVVGFGVLVVGFCMYVGWKKAACDHHKEQGR
jgi:hypothetical protein